MAVPPPPLQAGTSVQAADITTTLNDGYEWAKHYWTIRQHLEKGRLLEAQQALDHPHYVYTATPARQKLLDWLRLWLTIEQGHPDPTLLAAFQAHPEPKPPRATRQERKLWQILISKTN